MAEGKSVSEIANPFGVHLQDVIGTSLSEFSVPLLFKTVSLICTNRKL
jgi:hypothetical protein